MSDGRGRQFDVVILGAGAAGLLCAIEAGKRGRRVAVLESAERAGKKILISGGGRCNFTNVYCRAENFISANPHFAKSALAGYKPQDFIEMVERHGIAYHEKKLGQLFCDGSARQIVNMLLEESAAVGVQYFFNVQLETLERNGNFIVRTNCGEFSSDAVVVATGGPSIPKMGASGRGYQIARMFGLNVIEPRPALVSLVLSEPDRAKYCDLAGVAAEIAAKSGLHQFQERMLITHRGLSGPAVLQISSYWREGEAITIDLAPDRNIVNLQEQKAVPRDMPALRALLRNVLPHRLADRVLELAEPAGWSNAALAAWERQLHAWPIIPETTEGYDKAEVTAGGVDTNELSAKTMESKIPGLYFIGEVIDVTGQLGGFNFQWAWASGAAAGRAV